jgi:EAL domain-containing protein (putative c-di-GMP-specific phosphodiesterase class I)
MASQHLPGNTCTVGPHACAASINGCLRCDVIPNTESTASLPAILFAPRDQDAGTALQEVLNSIGFECATYGPLLIVRAIRGRLAELSSLLKARLSLYTLSCIKAAYCVAGAETVLQALDAMVFAEPLVNVLDHIEHEWVRTALSENWLFTVFHPIVDARSGAVFANEALLRARNPRDAAVIGAGQILGACERLNLMHQLDQRARQSAIRAAAEHLPTLSRVFINFLPNTIYDPEICLRTTMEAAAKYDVSMDRLVFEVVETERIPNMQNLLGILDYYRERGVGTAIDDMGAGYTAADYITSLRPDFVKLDREFVLTAEESEAGRQSMDSIITLSHANNAKVIAEGIETVGQMRMCVEAGVDLLQGFLFAKPACPPAAVSFPAGPPVLAPGPQRTAA